MLLSRSLLICACIFAAGNAFADELLINAQDFQPFSGEAQGVQTGAAVEIVKAACQKATISCKINFYPFVRALKNVEEGKEHGLFVISKIPEREAVFDFSEPLIQSEYHVFVNKINQGKFKTAADLSGKTIGVYGPSATATALKGFVGTLKDVKIDQTVDDIAAFKKLENNVIDAVYSNVDVGKMFIKDLQLKSVVEGLTHRKNIYYIGFAKKASPKKEIAAFFTAIKELKKAGEIKKILDKYSMIQAE